MRLSGWHVPIEQISASSLGLLIQCPEQFRLRRIKKIPESFGPDKFVGIVDHEAHAYNFKQKITTGADLEPEWMNGIYNARWDQQIEKDPPEWGEEDQGALKARGLLMVNMYHENVSPTLTPLHVEERFEHTVTGVPVPLVGYIDLETPRSIIDRKTTKTRLSKPKPKWWLQGQIYSMVYDKPVEWHLITKQVTPQIVLPTDDNELEIKTADSLNVNRTILQAAEMLNDFWCRYGPDNPWPTNGLLHDWACSYCGFGPRFGKQCVAWKDTNDTTP